MSAKQIAGRRRSRIANSAVQNLGQSIICRGAFVHTNAKAKRRPQVESGSSSHRRKQGARKGALRMRLKQAGLLGQMFAMNAGPLARSKRHTKTIPRLSMSGGFAGHAMFFGTSTIQRAAAYLFQSEAERCSAAA
jgi:hypothetical protein